MNENVFILAIVVIVTISGIYINYIRQRGNAKLSLISEDKSLSVFRVFIPLNIIVSFAFYYFEILNYSQNKYLQIFSVILIASGLLIRWYSVYNLGNAFQVQLAIKEKQKLNTSGIYKNIRHPSYLGLLMYYLGLGLFMHNFISLSLMIIIPSFVVINRILKEEIMLLKAFGKEYENYQKKSFKLIPYIY